MSRNESVLTWIQPRKNDGYYSTLIERGGCENSYDESLDVEYVALEKVLEIIDAKSREYIDWLNDRPHPDYGYHAAYINTLRDRIRKAVMELKNGTEE